MILVVGGAWDRPVVARAQAELPPEVRQALEGNARAFAPIALTLEKKRSVPEPRSKVAKKILAEFGAFLEPCTYEYLSQDGLCYARYYEAGRWTELSWNGKSVYRGAQSIKPPILSIVPIEKVESDGEFRIATWYSVDDYFTMIGIAVPCAMKELPEGPRSEVLRLLEGDGRVTAVRTDRTTGGAEHFVVELLSGGKKHRFRLDPSQGHAVSRHEVWAASGALAVVIDNSDFVKLSGPELWLPRRCRAEWHTWPYVADNEFSAETAAVVDVQATRLERTRVPPEKFTLNYDKAGSFISDAGLPGAEKGGGRVGYVVPVDPANLEEAIRAAQERGGYVPPRRPLVVWIIVGSIALGAAAFAIVLVRRRPGRRSTS